MKIETTLVTFLLALCLTNAVKVPAFEDGKRYIYEFKARSATGISDEVKQFSGFGVESRIIVQKQGDLVAFHMTDFKIGSFHKKLEHIMDEVEIDYKRTTGEQAGQERNLDLLERPFWVDFQEGVIKAIHFAPNEDIAKHNNKKAIAVLFQLDLPHSEESDLNFYVKEEDGIGGLCQTTYTVGEYPDNHRPKEQVLNVTKNRLYNDCKIRPHLFYSMLNGFKCKGCEQENIKPVKAMAQTQYNLKGSRKRYLIERIYATGAIDITPFTTNGQSVLSLVNQTLTLLEVEDASPIEIPSDLEKHTTLHCEFYNDKIDHNTKDLKEAHFYNRNFKIDRSHRMEKAEKLFYGLERKLDRDSSPKPSQFVPEIIDILTMFDYDDFDQLYNKLVKTSPQNITKKFFTEILPLVGTNPAILYAFHLIKEHKIDSARGSKIIQQIPFHVKEPSKKLVEAVKAFEKDILTHYYENGKLLMSFRLAFGTLLYKGCHESIFNPHPVNAKTYISKEDCANYVKELIDTCKKTPEASVRSIYLKAIINTGVKEAFDFVAAIAKSNQDKLLKLRAMWALTDIDSSEGKKKSASILMPLFNNLNEDYVVRIYAFALLLYRHPTPQFFDSLVLRLNQDPSHKLRSFIYSTLSSMAKTTDPCLIPYKQRARHVLEYVENYQPDIINDSLNRFFSVFNAKYNYGRSTQFAVVPGKESIFPRELYFRQSANLFGYNFDFVELGVSSEGFPLIEDLNASLDMAPSKLQTKQGQDTIISEFIQKAIHQFNLGKTTGKKHRYEVYAKMFGQYIYTSRDGLYSQDYYNIEDFTVDSVKEGVNLYLNMLSVRHNEVELLLPNELGMPVSLRARIPFSANLKGTLLFQENQPPVLTSNLHLRVDMAVYSHVVVHSLLFGDLGVALKTESGFHIPIKGSLNYNKELKETIIKYTPSTEPYDMLYYKTEPQTLGSADPLPVHYAPQPTRKQYHCGHDYFGVGFTHNFTYEYYRNDYGSYRDFFKSFLKKPISYEKYVDLTDRWYAVTRNFIDYALFNPTAKPFSYNARFSPCKSNPTTEFQYHSWKDNAMTYDSHENKGKTSFHYKGQIIGKGKVERNWAVEFKAMVQWPFKNVRAVEFNYTRSPLPNFDKNQFALCYFGKARITDYFPVYLMQPVDVKVNRVGRLAFGQNCSERAINIHTTSILEKSEEQKGIDKSTLPFYKKCQALKAKGFYFNNDCWKCIMDLGRLDKLTAYIEHKNLPDSVRGTFSRLYSLFRQHFYSNMEINHFQGSGKENRLMFTSNLSYYHPSVADIKIFRKDKTVYYNHIDLQSLLPHFEPVSVVEDPGEKIARKFFNYHPPTCFVTGKYVQTFDGFAYKLPLSKCYHLAFSGGLFSSQKVYIFFRAVEEGKYTKAAIVYIEDTLYEFVPHGDKIDVTANGRPIMNEHQHVYFHPTKDVAAIYESPIGNGYSIASKGYGLDFYFDGVNGMIEVSNFYRGTQKGICGNFNGEINDELQGPDGKLYDDPEAFANSYIVENDKCT